MSYQARLVYTIPIANWFLGTCTYVQGMCLVWNLLCCCCFSGFFVSVCAGAQATKRLAKLESRQLATAIWSNSTRVHLRCLSNLQLLVHTAITNIQYAMVSNKPSLQGPRNSSALNTANLGRCVLGYLREHLLLPDCADTACQTPTLNHPIPVCTS